MPRQRITEEELFNGYRNMPEQRQTRLVREPAEAVAIAKCLIHRLVGERKGDNKLIPWDSHPWKCRYCDTPTEVLNQVHDEWLIWSGEGPSAFFDIPEDYVQPGGVVAFKALPAEHSRLLVYEYQGYEVNEHGKPIPRGTKGATPHRVPKSRTRVDNDPDEGLPVDDIEASVEERSEDHRGDASVRDADGSPGQLWATRRPAAEG